MTRYEQALLDAILRSDFESFLRRCLMTLNPGMPYLSNWHIKAIAYQLERIRRGEINRLIINLPPRYLKSLMVSVAFPAFLLGQEPWHRIFAISYGAELSSKHARDFRSIVSSRWYCRTFPKMKVERCLDEEVTTSLKGFRKATSVDGPLTGLGGNIFIIDDPQKPLDALSEARRNRLNQWVTNTLMSRLDNKETGAIIVVMQRVHMDDLSGFLSSDSPDWEVLSLPAIADAEERIQIGDNAFHHRQVCQALHPDHESLETLRKLQQTLGPDDFSAQYQQQPVPPGGNMILREWLRYYETLPERTYRSKIIQSWDTAAKDGAQNDYSVCTTWLIHESNYYLLHLVRARFDYPRLRRTAIELAELYKPSVVLIEDASTGIALAQELGQVLRGPVEPVSVERDKAGRMYVQQQKFYAGLVHFPKGASFLPELAAELLAFPKGKTDDQVDSISQALSYERSNYAENLIAAMR
jgi:predicted phage terminase large subunit-like protein